MLSLCLYAFLVFLGFFSGSYLLLLTSLADYFLIFTDWYLPGILVFLLVQCGYRSLMAASAWPMLLSACLTLVLLRFLYPAADLLLLLAFCYGLCLLWNFIYSLKTRRFHYSFFFLLLLVCDLHVGLANLEAYYALPPGFLYAYQQAMPAGIFWLFYLPSQVMLTCMITPVYPRRNLLRISSSPWRRRF